MNDKKITIPTEEYEKYKEAIRRYQEFKKLRDILGKPIETTINPEKVRKDLTSKDFLLLVKKMKRKKG